ncbi:MAG TPA: hypothetical protein VD969_06310 [Symbiobacteriaceae bacterium]|nr:hypothetical protein [Symbiobacteriaceae bacterium]
MKRIMLMLVPLLLALGPSVTQAVTPPRIVLTRVDPPMEAIRGGSTTSIEIREPAEELVLLDQKGAPFLRMTKEGVFERKRSGALELVRKESFFYLHEGHVGAAVTDRRDLPYPWRIAGTYGGKPFVMEGTLVPPGARPDASPSFAPRVSILALAGLGVLIVVGTVGLALATKAFFRR